MEGQQEGSNQPKPGGNCKFMETKTGVGMEYAGACTVFQDKSSHAKTGLSWQVCVTGSTVFIQRTASQWVPWQLQCRLSDLIWVGVLFTDLIT